MKSDRLTPITPMGGNNIAGCSRVRAYADHYAYTGRDRSDGSTPLARVWGVRMSVEFREPQILVMCGIKGAGKSTLIRIMLTAAAARKDVARVLDPSANMGGEWPGRAAVENWLRIIIKANMDAKNKGRRPPTQILVVDDAEKAIKKTPPEDSPWVDVYTSNRHILMDAIFSCRRPQALPPELISGADWLYVFAISPADKTGMERARESIHDGQIPTKKLEYLRVSPLSGDHCYGKITFDAKGNPSVTETAMVRTIEG